MNFLGSLGIDIRLLIAQVINFAILLWILSKFLYKPLVKKIEADEAELKEAEMQQKELEKQRALFAQEQSSGTSQAKKKAKDIIDEAEQVAKKIKAEAAEDTAKEKQAVIDQIASRLTKIEHGEKKGRKQK
jgi:F-type H+-transporting ATPase subunit b